MLRARGQGVKMIHSTVGTRRVQQSTVPDAPNASDAIMAYARRRIAETGRLVVMHSWAGWDAGGGAQRPQQIAQALVPDACVVFCAAFHNEDVVAPIDRPILQTPGQWHRWVDIAAPVRIAYTAWPNDDALEMMTAMGPAAFTVVDIIDAWDGIDLNATWYRAEVEEAIVRQADLVVATAQPLVERADGYGPQQPARLLRNSSCLGGYDRAEGPPTVDCVYAGHLRNTWIDWKLIEKLAADHTVRIIGWAPDPLPFEHPNIEWVTQVAYHELMPLLSSARVGIIPFKKSLMMDAVDPIKVYDYALAGLPTVAGYLPELKGRSHVALSKTDRGFINSVEGLLAAEPDRAKIAADGQADRREVRAGQLITMIGDDWQPKRVVAVRPRAVDPTEPEWHPPQQDWPGCSKRVAWLFANTCRAHCPYCGVHDWFRERTMALGARWWTDEQAILAWEQAHTDHGPLVVEMSGLEASDQPELIGAVVRIGHKALLSTNLGMDLERWCAAVPTAGVELATSFHPAFWEMDIDAYLAKVSAVQEAGYHVSGASIVAHPMYWGRIQGWVDTLRTYGLYTTLHPLQGKYKDKVYPQAFTDEERVLLAQNVSETKQKFALDWTRSDTLCAAGWMYVQVGLDGAVTRCIQNLKQTSENFFRGPLTFTSGPEWCEGLLCACEQYWPYHIPEGAAICPE